MPVIVQTGPAHPGGVLYICRKESDGRKAQFDLRGYRADAQEFDSLADAENAMMQFSSMYGLVTKETA